MLNYEYLEIVIDKRGFACFKFVIDTHVQKRKWWQFWKQKLEYKTESMHTAPNFPIDEDGIIIGNYHIRKIETK